MSGYPHAESHSPNESTTTRLDLAGCAALLGLTPLRVRWWDLTGQFADPSGRRGKHRYWERDGLYAWAATSSLRLSDRVPLSHWPAAVEPAPYMGAYRFADSVALIWATTAGALAVVWRLPGRHSPLSGLVKPLRERGVAGAAVIDYDFGFDGPSVTPIPLTPQQGQGPHLSWTELSKLIGQPLPYWPTPLRQEDLLTSWQPGLPTVEALATDPELDTDALLRMASLYEADHPAARVLVHMARTVIRREYESAKKIDLGVVAEAVEAGTAVVAARPIPVPAIGRDDVDETTRRLGWVEILSRQDTLAEHCVLQMVRWNNGDDCPFGHRFTVTPGNPLADEWIARLKPTGRTAAFRLLGEFDADEETLLDPATDAPVVRRRRGDEIELRGATLKRLPATAPLSQLILDDPIWVRTADGTLYPAPQDSYWGISWGYSGSGPGSLALLIHRLLDDINARAADNATGAPPGLQRLTRIKMPRGTVLSRKQLEAARSGAWQPTEDDFPRADD